LGSEVFGLVDGTKILFDVGFCGNNVCPETFDVRFQLTILFLKPSFVDNRQSRLSKRMFSSSALFFDLLEILLHSKH